MVRTEATWTVPRGAITWSAEHRAALQSKVLNVADRLLSSRAFAVTLVYSLSLPEHRDGIEQRPASPLEWDRKAWSHLNFFASVGVPLDPGNWMLYFAWLLLLARAGACTGKQSRSICPGCEAGGGDLDEPC